MAFRLIKANEATATRRRVYFDIRDGSDGITPITTISGGQPQISTNGGSFTNTGIGTLTHTGVGRYYADLTQAAVANAGDVMMTRFKSAVSAETPGDMAVVVAFDPYDANGLGLLYLDATIASRLATAGYTSPPSTSDIATAVWAFGSRTLSSFGSLVSDIAAAVWAAGTRTLTAFGFTTGLATSAKQDEILAKVTGGLINVVNPLDPKSEELTLYRGIDYGPTLNNAPTRSQDTWTNATWAGAAGVFRYRQSGSVVTAGTVSLSQSSDTLTATLTLTAAETAAMVANQYGAYEIEITSTGGLKRIIAAGTLNVRDLVEA